MTINKANSSTSITADTPDPSLVDQPYTVTVAVTGLGETPTGSVTVSDGEGQTCPITLSGGTGSCTLSSTTPGVKTVIATYNGDANYTGSSDTESHTVEASPPNGLINRIYLPFIIK
jgi:hypothetical protein